MGRRTQQPAGDVGRPPYQWPSSGSNTVVSTNLLHGSPLVNLPRAAIKKAGAAPRRDAIWPRGAANLIRLIPSLNNNPSRTRHYASAGISTINHALDVVAVRTSSRCANDVCKTHHKNCVNSTNGIIVTQCECRERERVCV